MPRRLKVRTREMGDVNVWLLQPEHPQWQALEGTPMGNLIAKMPRTALEHALNGWSRPFVDAIGIPPDGAIRKLPRVHHECAMRKTCSMWRNASCRSTARDMPVCFEPDGLPAVAAEVIRYWREGVYVLVTGEDQ